MLTRVFVLALPSDIHLALSILLTSFIPRFARTECGHHSFSTNPALDNLVGYVLHTLLLVPYYSWQITHAKHHHHTGHMSKDQVSMEQLAKPGERTCLGPRARAKVGTNRAGTPHGTEHFLAWNLDLTRFGNWRLTA